MNFFQRIAILTFFGCSLAVSQYANAQMPMEATPEHKLLAEDVGTWNAEMKIWAAGPDSEPMTAQATEVNEMLGDYWLVSKFSGNVMGQDFEGRASIGYDVAKKKYIGTWYDGMSPFMSHMEGTYDKQSKTLTMMSKGTGPDGKPTTGKNVTVTNDDGTKVFTMFVQSPEAAGELVKMMEITYKKK